VDAEHGLSLAWKLVDAAAPEGLAAAAAALDPSTLDRTALLGGARRGGVPIIPLVPQLRAQAEGVSAGSGAWVHRGATSQDILDTGLVLVAARAFRAGAAALSAAGRALVPLAAAEGSTLMVGRTLGQHAAPVTAGVVISGWLDGITSAIDLVSTVRLPVQLGGAVGTGESFDVIAGRPVHPELRAAFAAQLSLDDPGRSWATERTPLLAIASAAAGVVAATARIGRDLAALTRTEVGEFALGSAGGSSAMPQKQNPVDAVLLTAAGLRAPGLLATVQTAAISVDQRPVGEWHAEWLPLRELLRLCEQTTSLTAAALAGLTVDRSAIARNLALTGDAIFSERVSLGGRAGDSAPTLVASARIVAAAGSRFEAAVAASLRSPR
jgi:3-carboxy-cis,cis-muconate cycloisomerase